MTDELDNHQMMCAAVQIARIAAEMPIDLAVSVLMLVVTELIQQSGRDAMAYWDTLAIGVEAHRRIQRRFVPGSNRMQ